MISEIILNNMSILSSSVLNNIGRSTHWETKWVAAEITAI